jgi:hypothetical protein
MFHGFFNMQALLDDADTAHTMAATLTAKAFNA